MIKKNQDILLKALNKIFYTPFLFSVRDPKEMKCPSYIST